MFRFLPRPKTQPLVQLNLWCERRNQIIVHNFSLLLKKSLCYQNLLGCFEFTKDGTWRISSGCGSENRSPPIESFGMTSRQRQPRRTTYFNV